MRAAAASRYEEQGPPQLRPAGAQSVHGRLSVVFLLRRRDTGGVVHRYATEGAALGFVRDVLRVGGREQAAGFVLEQLDEGGQARTAVITAASRTPRSACRRACTKPIQVASSHRLTASKPTAVCTSRPFPSAEIAVVAVTSGGP